ncbi:glycosyltransferase family 2 protein [Lacinutrix chionoecetis]
MDSSLVSVIIPTFNKVQLAIETLKSVQAQTYKDWECIVIDDGSDKEDFQALETFIQTNDKITLHKRPKSSEKGANACRNYGVSLSKGKYLQFFDSDDLMKPECLEGRINAIKTNDFDFVVFSMALIYGQEKMQDKDLYFVTDWDQALKAFLKNKKLPWNLQRTLFKSSLIKGKILFNEKLKRFQDVEFNIKVLIACQPKFMMSQQIDCYYRFVSAQNKRNNQFNYDVFQSIPEFLKSINELVTSDVFVVYQKEFQERVYMYISLYTVKKVTFSQLKEVLKASRKYINLSRAQQILLIFLFYGKKYLENNKGKRLYFKSIKQLYT